MAAECLGSGGALAFHVRITRCPPFAGGAEDTMGALRVGQFGTTPEPEPEKELLVRACASFKASLRLRACSSLWVGVRSGAVLQPVQPICIAPAIAMATNVKQAEQLRVARIRSKKRDFRRRNLPWNRARARLSFLFKTLARFARPRTHPRKRRPLIPVQYPQYKEHAAETNGKKDDSALMMEFSSQI
jgi:hypothetical protein